MNVSVGSHWEQFVDELVQSGRYGTASEVMREGLRLVEAREAQLKALKGTIEASLAKGGSHTDEEVGAYLAEHVRTRRAPRAAE
ncbi:MAG: type II toxin-antitoxin system ParD family antitoxin [Devosia sp.]